MNDSIESDVVMAGLDVKVGDSQRLAVLGKEISMSFDLLSQSDFEGQLQDYAPADWEHEAERFSLWANNLGLHHRGHSSLDYRLREAKALRNLIGDYLTDLKTSLDECMYSNPLLAFFRYSELPT